MPSKIPPYRFSKKAQRYIPTSKKVNREFYYQYLERNFEVPKFSPHSTYGKLIMRRILPDLRLHRNLASPNKYETLLKGLEKELENLKSENKLKPRNRREKKIKELTLNSISSNNRVLYFLKHRSGYISFFLFSLSFGIIFFLLNNNQNATLPFPDIFFLLLGPSTITPLILYPYSKIVNWIFDKHYDYYTEKAKELIEGEDFSYGISESEKNLESQIDNAWEQVIRATEDFKILTERIQDKINNLTSEEYTKFILSPEFYNSSEWRSIKNKSLNSNKLSCRYCGSKTDLEVDHILPRSKYPEKALDLSNTQILCKSCNTSKGNKVRK